MQKQAFTFPYLTKISDTGDLLNPIVKIPVKTNAGWQKLWFLVDSGADTTTLTLSLAKKLGLNINLGSKTILFGIGERKVGAYSGSVILQMGGNDYKVRCFFMDAEDSVLLLGRLDVFDKFSITFDPKKRIIIFNPI